VCLQYFVISFAVKDKIQTKNTPQWKVLFSHNRLSSAGGWGRWPTNRDKSCMYIYRVPQEECARLREGVPYVKVY
jgi:hypothetical protein